MFFSLKSTSSEVLKRKMFPLSYQMIFIHMKRPLSKRFFVDLLPEIEFNEDQVIVPWEVLRVLKICIKSIKNISKSLFKNFVFFVEFVESLMLYF